MKRAVLFLGVAVVAGCGGSKSSGHQTAAATVSGAEQSGATLSVHEKEFSLSPTTLRVAKPGTYTLKGVNDGTTEHALALKGSGIDKKSKAVRPGQATILTVTLAKPGRYVLYCPLDHHRQQGMAGTLLLGQPPIPTGTSSTQTQTQPPTSTGGYGHGY